jgi:UDP-N-acetyl-D-glucosamine dehydrogenase
MHKELLEKIKSKKFSVTVVGLGYVGLPLLLRFKNKGIKIFGVDNDSKKISNLKNGVSYISDIKKDDLKFIKKNKKIVSSDFELVKKSDVIILCLPTPLGKKKEPDLSYLLYALRSLKKYLDKGKILIIESTVYPGATKTLLKKINFNKFKIGSDFFIGYSPERENPGDKNFSYNATPKLVSGYSKNCIKIIKAIYKHIVKKPVITNSIEVAETSKLLENMYRSVNISLVNELKMICKKIGIDVMDVIEAAATKNFGFQKFYPGPGMGGHCIPIDPYYLSWASKKKGYTPKFIKTSGDLNSVMPKWIVKNIVKKFKYLKLKYKNSKILLIGVSYKKNVGDDRESPFFSIVKELKKYKINYDYFDPFFLKIKKGRNFKDDKKSINLNGSNIKKYIATVIITDHDKINYDLLCKYSKIIFDTRYKLKSLSKKYNNIFFL